MAIADELGKSGIKTIVLAQDDASKIENYKI